MADHSDGSQLMSPDFVVEAQGWRHRMTTTASFFAAMKPSMKTFLFVQL